MWMPNFSIAESSNITILLLCLLPCNEILCQQLSKYRKRMSIAGAFPLCHFHGRLLPGKSFQLSRERKEKLQNSARWCQCPDLYGAQKRQPLVMKAQLVTPSTFSSTISSDIPFDEAPQEEWRIHMVPIQSLFLTVRPVVYMRLRCHSNVLEYPSHVPHDTPKILELEINRSEIHGLDDLFKPSEFSLGVKGAMYCYRKGKQSRLRGRTQLSMSFIMPQMLARFTEHVGRNAAELVLRGVAENMKHAANTNILADYTEFKKERLKALACQMDLY